MAGSGSTLTDLYTSAQKLKFDLQGGLERLEKLETAASVGYGSSHIGRQGYSDTVALSPDLTEELGRKLKDLQRLSADMDRLLRSQVQFHKSHLWKRKVEMIAEEAESLKQGLDKYLFRENRRQREAADRAQLMHRATAREGAEILSEFDADQRDMERAKNSGRMLEDTLLSGYATLKRMAEQREVLKGAQRRVLDVLNYIGSSDAVLKKINRRHVKDKIIAYGGMALVLLIVFFVWRNIR